VPGALARDGRVHAFAGFRAAAAEIQRCHTANATELSDMGHVHEPVAVNPHQQWPPDRFNRGQRQIQIEASERRVDERQAIRRFNRPHFVERQKNEEALEVWKRSFPLEFRPVNSLAHNFLGVFDRAIVDGTEAVRRNPAHGFPYSNLAHAYRGSGRLDAARKTAEQAVALGIETLPTRVLFYQLAVMTGDDSAAMQHLEWARDRPREFDMVGARAQASGWAGKVGDARRLYEDAARMAQGRNLPDVGTSQLAWAIWTDGPVETSKEPLNWRAASSIGSPSYDPRRRAALTLALTGADCEAEAIANELAAANPEHAFIKMLPAERTHMSGSWPVGRKPMRTFLCFARRARSAASSGAADVFNKSIRARTLSPPDYGNATVLDGRVVCTQQFEEA
jgi:tetratricopeptide (TPR) repeat protein